MLMKLKEIEKKEGRVMLLACRWDGVLNRILIDTHAVNSAIIRRRIHTEN